jgi:hypothetical protein
MGYRKHLLIALIVLISLQFWACQKDNNENNFEHPSDVEDIEGSDFRRIMFTEKAMERIGVQTSTIIQTSVSVQLKIIPYSALLHDPNGQTFVYASREPSVFLKYSVKVDYIEGRKVFLNEGPPLGTVVATDSLGIRTATVSEVKSIKQMKIIPYSALIYDPSGLANIYINPEPRVFIRYPVDVAYIKGDLVYLNEGPPVGTRIATMGVPEIYGTEFEIGH